MEEPLRYETLTGLSHGQLAELAARVAGRLDHVVRPGGRPEVTGTRTQWRDTGKPQIIQDRLPLPPGNLQIRSGAGPWVSCASAADPLCARERDVRGRALELPGTPTLSN